MSSSALESQQTTLQMANVGSPADYETINEVRDLNFRTGSAAVIDVTDLLSTAKEKRMGLQDEGQCTFTLNFIPTDEKHAELLTAKGDRQARNFKLTLSDGTAYTFSGFVLAVPMSAAVDGVLTSAVVVEITGGITEL